jgi:hypothetical protein
VQFLLFLVFGVLVVIAAYWGFRGGGELKFNEPLTSDPDGVRDFLLSGLGVLALGAVAFLFVSYFPGSGPEIPPVHAPHATEDDWRGHERPHPPRPERPERPTRPVPRGR